MHVRSAMHIRIKQGGSAGAASAYGPPVRPDAERWHPGQRKRPDPESPLSGGA